MIIANLEYLNVASELNKVEGGYIKKPYIPYPKFPHVDDIKDVVKEYWGKVQRYPQRLNLTL